MKAMLREIAVIVGGAAVVGLVYNAVNPHGLPLLRKEQRLPMAADSLLFQGLEQKPEENTTRAPEQQGEHAQAQSPEPAQRKEAQRESPPAAVAERSPAEQPAEPAIWAVRYEQVLRLLENPELLLIDARRPEDYAAGHIPGARNVFAYDFAAHIPEFITLPRTKPILIYCDGGQCELSRYLAEQLRTLGFRRLYIYEGGWEEWRQRHNQ